MISTAGRQFMAAMLTEWCASPDFPIGVDDVDLDRPIPSDYNHAHLGNGQTEALITLPPGYHTLQPLPGDRPHIPHDPPVMPRTIYVR
jgi:hypothetical protein